MADLAGHEVKCAGCREYFRPGRMRQEKNAYYCRTCHGLLSRKEQICPVCGRLLTPFDAATKDGGFSYCPECYDRVTAPGGAREAAAPEDRCSGCGKALSPKETRVLYANSCYCIPCYEKATPYLDAKPYWLQPGDSVAAMRTGRKFLCGKCSRDLGPLDVKVREGKDTYCESCYRNLRKDPAGQRFYVAERAGMITGPGATSLKDAASIVECASCGWVITRDRLEALKRDARGRLRCSRCGKPFAAAPGNEPSSKTPSSKAPEEPKPAKPDPAELAVTAQLFKCLGDPCRVKIIESLSEKELCVFEFVDLTGFQYSAISYHLKMLKELDIVRSYERGNFVVYSLTEKGQVIHEFIRKSRELK